MKIISLYQPWATLVVLGAKRFETRSWDTRYRGSLGIHATKAYPRWAQDLCLQEPFHSVLRAAGLDSENLQHGAIIGQVELVATVPVESMWTPAKGDDPALWAMELKFGDYSAGRFAWELVNPVRFEKPIPAKGAQGFWNYELEKP